MWATYELNGTAHHKKANPVAMSVCVKGLNGGEEFEPFLLCFIQRKDLASVALLIINIHYKI